MDKVTVYITVLEQHRRAFIKATGENPQCEDNTEADGQVETVVFTLHDIHPWGGLILEEALKEQGIPYDVIWGGEYDTPGARHFRISEDGQAVLREFEGHDIGMVPLDEVIAADAAGTLTEYLAAKKADMVVMPWLEQQMIVNNWA